MNYGKVFLVLAMLSVLAFAAETADASNIGKALACMYDTIKNVLAIGMLLLVVLAAVVYAVGQVMGAETRARASVWATAMFTGAIIGALIYILLPFVFSNLMPDMFKADGTLVNAITCGTAEPVVPP